VINGELEPGVYERLLTDQLSDKLEGLRALVEQVDEADQPSVLAAFVADQLRRTLEDRAAADRVGLVNEILARVADAQVAEGPRQLLAVGRPGDPAGAASFEARPATSLSRPALLTNSRTDPKLGAELRAEIATADRVDLLCAFVKWYGLRVLEDELQELKRRGVQFRVLTTTYMGATDRTALDRLVREFGAVVKVNYETASTRLHAKAWLFRRNSGYHTAYVGSSNLSRAALVDGLEWNVKLAGAHTPELVKKFEATFDSYWVDPAFLPYDPDRDGDRLDEALARAGGAQDRANAPMALSGLDVRPYPHQQEMLDQLEVERTVHDRHDNLVVAATGTGKTVVAAFDYKRMEGRPRLLFVAHRREILDQSIRRFREVLGDATFGERYVGGDRPQRWEHVFASVQSLTALGIESIAPDHFDVVIIDEFHHAQAATYRRLLDHLRPKELLGLTATPERGDGVDVRSFFGGRTAAELRLWDALESDLLCPFHYFGIHDETDLSRLDWRKGEYEVSALENLYTADDARVRIVLRELSTRLTDPRSMRALGFCVSVRHAEFMADRFTEAGIPALAVSAATSSEDRESALRRLRDREVNVLFAVDLFNEGLDIPDIDTLLMLRPTASATVFLQQLGRGLRRTADKPVLTVLDFIGLQRAEFRFDAKLRAMTGSSRSALTKQIEGGFAFLPSGCEIVLDRVAKEIVLANVRSQLTLNRKALALETRGHGDLALDAWLAETGRDLADVFRFGSWTELRRHAGFPTPAGGPREEQLLKRTSAFAHVDDPERAAAYTRFLDGRVEYDALDELQKRYARMLFFSLWPNAGGFTSYQEGFDLLAQNDAVRDEIRQVVGVALGRATHVTAPLEPGMERVTLRTHAHYSREEVLAALDWANLDRKPSAFVTGVVWSEEMATDAFFVTLQKSEAEYKATTMYRDFAISPDVFHWESQNATSTDSPVGQRYLRHREMGSHILILARTTKSNEWKGPRAFRCLGPASIASHQGERPIEITWNLEHSMATDFFHVASLTG
jgi:superfamily II DNA or RNA helicase/HKD family nuclease